jgi:hypothetical protein
MAVLSDIEKVVDRIARDQQPTAIHKIDRKMSVDQEMMKKRWEAAKDEKEKTVALITFNELVLHDLNQVIHRATNDLVQLMEQFAGLSLSGCFLEQLGSGVRLLEHRYKDLEKTGADQVKVKKSLDATKKLLEFLSNAMKNSRGAALG